MMENLAPLIIFGIPLSLWFLWSNIYVRLRARRAWQKFAAQKGLLFKARWIPSDVKLSGIYLERKVHIETFCNTERFRDNSYTMVKLSLKRKIKIPPLTIEPRRDQFFKAFFLNKDAFIEESDLRQRFEIKSRSEKFIAYLLKSNQLRQALYQTFLPKLKRSGEAKITIDAEQILYRQRSSYALQSHKDLESMLALLHIIAALVESP